MVAETTWGETISDLTADLDRIIDRRQRLAADIEEAFLEHPLGKVLNSMCGFGPRTGARTLAEIGDPHRFANPGTPSRLRRTSPRQLAIRPHQQHPTGTRRQPPRRQRHVHRRVRRLPNTTPTPAPTTYANEPKAKNTLIMEWLFPLGATCEDGVAPWSGGRV